MGFRSTMVTEDLGLEIPQEFLDKYPYIQASDWNTPGKYRLPLSLKTEIKFYSAFEDTDIFKDIQNLMIEQNFNTNLSIVLLHECGGISKIEITKDSIVGLEPINWKIVAGVEHNYCYGCSDYSKALTESIKS